MGADQLLHSTMLNQRCLQLPGPKRAAVSLPQAASTSQLSIKQSQQPSRQHAKRLRGQFCGPINSLDRESIDLDEAAALQLADYDIQREKNRRFRRTVFTHDRWSAHRSTDRYLRHLRSLLQSRTFIALSRPLAVLAANAITVGKLTPLHLMCSAWSKCCLQQSGQQAHSIMPAAAFMLSCCIFAVNRSIFPLLDMWGYARAKCRVIRRSYDAFAWMQCSGSNSKLACNCSSAAHPLGYARPQQYYEI